MSHSCPPSPGFEVSSSLKKADSSASARKRVSWQPDSDGHNPLALGEVLGSHEEESTSSPLTDVSHFTNSPTWESHADFSSAGNSMIGAGPASQGAPETGNLKTQLNKAFRRSLYDENKIFLPRDDLERIITPDSVTKYCKGSDYQYLQDEPSKIVDYVFGSQTRQHHGCARRVFAILVLINHDDLIQGVVKENIRDHDLPLAQCDEQGTEYQLARRRRRPNQRLRAIQCFSHWRMSDRRAFDDIQFQVNSPVFKLLLAHQDVAIDPVKLDSRYGLPFTFYDEEKQINSGSAKVVRVKIHHAHHDFNTEENEYFALKTLDAGSPESKNHFRLEVKALMKIRAKKKEHLVDVLTTFQYDSKYHLLFRWADGGNLSDLWRGLSNRPLTRDLVCWIAQQCQGLADGLDGIHNAKLSSREVDSTAGVQTAGKALRQTMKNLPLYDNKDCGRHGDIKPPNILWFKQDANGRDYDWGVLKISDFGLTTFHTALTTQVSPREQNGCTWTYAPPEYDLKEDISRPFDIWSLGCVYLEFVTWALLGSRGVHDFAHKRLGELGDRPKMRLDSFYSLVQEAGQERHAIVKHCVKDWIEHLKSRPECSTYMSDFLDYTATKMIVVDKSKRDKSPIVKRRLAEFLQECEAVDSSYAFNPDTAADEVSSGTTVNGSFVQRRRGKTNSMHKNKTSSTFLRIKRKLHFWP